MVTALIPAAGQSARLGQPKQLVTFRGERLVDRAVRIAREAGCDDVVVVTGAVPLDVHHARLVPCANWADGPGASLRTGAMAIDDDVLVLLVDQWRLEAGHLRALLQTGGEVVAAHYANGLGAPVKFMRARLPVLRSLEAEHGAKRWLRTHAHQVVSLVLPEAETDLDTPAALAAMRAAEV